MGIFGAFFKNAERIIKYTGKGGEFRKKEDVLKIYGFPQRVYDRIKGQFIFEVRNEYVNVKSGARIFSEEKLSIVDLNTADSVQLLKLSGIGPKLARRIILYRNSLGGFYEKKQIADIYGLDSTTYTKLLPYLSIDKDFRTIKLSLSKSESGSWFRHPYFRKIAKEIIQLKKKNAALKKDEFLEHFGTAENEKARLAAYLQD